MKKVLLIFLFCLFFKSSLGSIGETVHSKKKRDIKLRLKRNSHSHYLYEPMRIHSYYTDQISLELSKTEQQRLQNIVDIAASKVTQLLSVIPVSGPLFLSRTKACQTVWVDGPNVGRCGRLKSNYDGELCFSNIDNFKIPVEHLEEFFVYSNVVANQSKIVFPKGVGVQKADFILYIRSSFTFSCQSRKVIAYAKYCQQDQHGRPISGYVNFCPAHLKDDLYDHGKAILTIIHELLHALGFSKDLFSSFEECSDFIGKCSKRSKIVRYDESSQIFRLILPSVIREMQTHFNCSRENFGAPLETKDGEHTSHWDPKILYGSIMAPTLGRSHQTIIDRITLAVLEDSGWYQVNYDAAETYLWGRNEGCQFGLQHSCIKSSDYFCQGNSSGCHHLHLDKAVCSEESSLNPCRVMRSEDQDQCTRMNPLNLFLKPGEVYGPSSRCFLSNISSNELTGFCFKHRCLPHNILQIEVKQDLWLNCSFGTSIQIPGYDGIVQCPAAGILCSLPEKSFPTTLTLPNSKLVTSPTHFTHTEEEDDTDDQIRAHLTICFPELHYKELVEQHQIEAFEWQVIRLISNVTGVSESRIINVKIKPDSVISLEIQPPESIADGASVFDATSKLINAVHSGLFSVRFNGTLRSASNLRILNEEPQTYPASWSEIQIAVIILGLIALIVLAFTITIIIRKKCYRTVQTLDQTRT